MKKEIKPKVKNWINLIENGIIEKKIIEIAIFIKNNPKTTIYHIKKIYKIKHQTLTSAISNLMDDGIVEVTGEIKIGNYYYSVFEIQLNEEKIKINAYNRKKEKFKLWLEKGINEYKNILDMYVITELENLKSMIK